MIILFEFWFTRYKLNYDSFEMIRNVDLKPFGLMQRLSLCSVLLPPSIIIIMWNMRASTILVVLEAHWKPYV